MRARNISWPLALTLASGCASGKRWVNQPFHHSGDDHGIRIYDGRKDAQPGAYDKRTSHLSPPIEKQVSEANPEALDDSGPRPSVRLSGTKKPRHVPPPDGRLLGEFRNTYYDFPAEAGFISELPVESAQAVETVPLMNASCRPIKDVVRPFFESLCVQGSGTLVDGTTVSFAKRDCTCAAVCPRTSQKICFDALDSRDFPWGRGALGKAITPLLSVAVDSDVVPLGTHLYIAEFDGVERHPGGGRHDGCFVAEDRGMKVKGKHVDVFTGNPTVTAHLNAIVPSNVGVHVYLDTARCAP